MMTTAGIRDPADHSRGKEEDIMDSVSSMHPLCPKCELPMFSEDENSYFCASCEEVYSYDKNGDRLEKVRKKSTVDRRMKAIIVSSILIFLLIIGSMGAILVLRSGNEGMIDITDVADIRHLDVEKEVPIQYMRYTDYDDYISEKMTGEFRQELRELEIFYKSLLVIDRDWDIVSMAENETPQGILGFYDTEDEVIYFMEGDCSTEYRNYVLAHEYTHALQDQNFDLDRYLDTGNYDVDYARSCVIEGDAVTTMDIWASENLDLYERMKVGRDMILQSVYSSQFSDWQYENAVLSGMYSFPYDGGSEFVKRVLEIGGWEGVNELYTERPPLSSEQILHFDKYFEYEAPVEINLEFGMYDDDLIFSSSVGEKLIRELLPSIASDVRDIEEDRADIGWGGDEFHYFENGTDHLSLFVSEWDSEELNDLFATLFEGKIDSLSDPMGNRTYYLRGSIYSIRTCGKRTYVLESNDEEWLDDAAFRFVR